MWMLLGILVVGALGGVCMAALRNVSGDVGGGMGRDYMEKEWGITENKKEQKDKMKLSEQIKKQDAKAFTHSGKFHADDVFSSALLLYLNPQITITRGNQVPEGYDGIVFDIGRGQYDHHQRDSRVRENGVPYAAFFLCFKNTDCKIINCT